ncbi:MAG: hypothetical protein EZS28_016278, partial [Streblomastix strix]
VGITYQDYDNSNVILAGGGVRAIADIQSASYSKSEDDALLLLTADKRQLIDAYSKTEADALLDDKLNVSDQIDAYNKQEDDALLLLKADKTQLIDAYSKTEADALLDDKLNITDQIDAYTKGKDDALLLLKADKTQLIDAYNKSETDQKLALKLNITDQIDAYSKTQDDALLLLKADKTQLIDGYNKSETDNLLNNKANQSTTYTKTETDQLISQIDVGDVDLTDYYNKTKTDELLGEKVDTTDLDDYMTLGTAQTITANKTFQNACRFTSSIDGMSSITGQSFIKSGADDSVVLLGAGGTKPISEFGGGSVDDSNYAKKDGQATQSIEGNLIRSGSEISFENLQPFQYITKQDAKYGFVQKEGQLVQEIEGKLRRKQEDEESQDGDYLTKEEMDDKYVRLIGNQTINGTKTFTISVTAPAFVKYSGTNQQVLLADGTIKPLSEFTTTIDDSNYVKKDGDVQDIQGILRKTTLDQPYPEPTDDDYITLGAVKSEFVSSIYSGSINGNLTATSFIKSDKDDTSVYWLEMATDYCLIFLVEEQVLKI